MDMKLFPGIDGSLTNAEKVWDGRREGVDNLSLKS